MKELPFSKKSISSVLALLFAVGLIGHAFDSTRQMFINATPIFLLAVNLFVVYILGQKFGKWFLFWVMITFVLTFAIELIGVATGSVFGSYSYGDTLGPKLFDVPVIIGLNWVLVIAGSIGYAERLIKNPNLIPLGAALFATFFDVILEPIAVALGYWRWKDNVIPLQNYIAWFVISFLFALFYIKLNQSKEKERLSLDYYLIQLAFFSILNFIL